LAAVAKIVHCAGNMDNKEISGPNLTTLAEYLVDLFLRGVEAHVAHVQRCGLKIYTITF
jgi:hypothetical protein